MLEAFLGRGTVAEENQRDLRALLDVGGPCETHGMGDSVSDGTRDRGDMPLPGAVVGGYLPSLAEVFACPKELREELLHRHTALKERTSHPIVGKKPVLLRQRHRRRNGEGFFTLGRAVDAHAPLPMQTDHLRIEQPCLHHQGVQGEQ